MAYTGFFVLTGRHCIKHSIILIRKQAGIKTHTVQTHAFLLTKNVEAALLIKAKSRRLLTSAVSSV